MADNVEPTDLLGLPSRLLDQVVEILAGVGIELPSLLLQGFLLVLVLLALFVALRPLRARWPQVGALPLLGAGAIALVALGILAGIGSQLALPDRLVGRVESTTLAGVRVELLDFRGVVVSGGGSADTTSGEFVAYYQPLWHGRARTLRITAPGCKARDHAIARSRLDTESAWEFTCVQP